MIEQILREKWVGMNLKSLETEAEFPELPNGAGPSPGIFKTRLDRIFKYKEWSCAGKERDWMTE